MKRIMALLLTIVTIAVALAGCKEKTTSSGHSLTVSGIGGSLNFIPVYIAQQKGWFEEAGLEIKEVLFTNGPVQMEALSSNGWDIGCTGVGGVLSGVIGYDAIVVGASNTDNGTQYAFARSDSEIVAAGTGHNTINPYIYGDAKSWKGKKILCNTGTVLQYLLIKTLGGFGLTTEDVTFVAMDAPTAYSAFLAGEGDVAVLTGSSGTFNMLADKENYTAVSSGDMAGTGLLCNFVANKNSYADPKKYEAMKIFLKVYFKSLDWMKENPDAAVEYMVDFSDESGTSMEPETAAIYMQADKYFTLLEAYNMINIKAKNADVSIMEAQLLDVLNFFIEYGNYTEGDVQKFLNHTDASLLNDVWAELQGRSIKK